jgi:hypothetical protein
MSIKDTPEKTWEVDFMERGDPGTGLKILAVYGFTQTGENVI